MGVSIKRFVIGSQFLGVGSIFLMGMFIAVFGGGFDIMPDTKIPGLNATCILLPIVVTLSLFFYTIRPKLKNRNLFDLLLIPILILCVALDVEAVMMLIVLAQAFV